MMKLLKRILKLGTLNRQRYYFGEIKEWEDMILHLGDPSMMRKGENEYILCPNTSAGLSYHRSSIIRFVPITVFAKLTLVEPGKYHVQFTSLFRPEQVYIAITFITILMAGVFLKMELWMFFFLPAVWIGSHIWFYFIYSAQDEWVVEELTKKLRLYKVNRGDK